MSAPKQRVMRKLHDGHVAAAHAVGQRVRHVERGFSFLSFAPSPDPEKPTANGTKPPPSAASLSQLRYDLSKPGWELVRQQPPRAATPNNVEDGVQDLTHRMKPGSADTTGRLQKWIQTGKLSVREIGQVGSP
jgi:hypothetical protein